MGLRITTNVSAINTHRALSGLDRGLARSFERLASGLRVNRASDDAAGLSISEGLRAQSRGSHQAARNILDAISMLGVAEGAMNEMHAVVQRMRELAVQAANGSYTDSDRASMNAEFMALAAEIGNLTGNTTFNELFMFSGIGGAFMNSGLRTSPNVTIAPLGYGGLSGTTNRAAAVGTNTYTLGGLPEVYNLGSGNNESIKVEVFDSGTGTWSNVAHNAANGFTYNAGGNSITLNGSSQIQAGETQVRISYIRQGMLTQTLSPPPIGGTETVRMTDSSGTVTLGAGDYTLVGDTITLTGANRPGAGGAVSFNVNYIRTGTTTIPMSTLLPANPFGGGILDPASVSFRINGADSGFSDGSGFTIQQTQTDGAGQTPLYSYSMVIDNADLVGLVSTNGVVNLSARYAFDFPTTVSPLLLDMQVGANSGQTLQVQLDRVSLTTLGLNTSDLLSQDNAAATIAAADAAIAMLSEQRSRYGAYVNRLEHTLNNIRNVAQQMDTAFSAIRDADMADQMTTLTRQQILNQSATQMLRTSNIQPSQLLKLLTAS